MTVEVDSSVIEGVRSGKVKGIAVSVREENQNMFLENIDGKNAFFS